jgi:hypothetical protein
MNKKYKEYKENLLLELEKSLLPETQVMITNKKVVENELKEMDQSVWDLTEALNRLVRKQDRLRTLVRNDDYRGMGEYLNKKDEDNKSPDDSKTQEKERRAFIKPCPAPECRGFLSTQYKCGMCDTKCCPDCGDILSKDFLQFVDKLKKQEDLIKRSNLPEEEKEQKINALKEEMKHKCDSNTLETMKALMKECKNCPKCGTYIYKIAGCDMMFCTSCKTAFSWKSGEIVTKNIHNPHYFEYLRENGQEDDEIRRRFGGGAPQNRAPITDIECITYEQLYNGLMNSNYNELFRMINHLERVDIPRYALTQNIQNRNLDLRVNYLLRFITENDLKIKLQRRYKKEQFDAEMLQILEMYSTVIKEIFVKFIRELDPEVKTKMFGTFGGRYDYRLYKKFRYPDSSKMVSELLKLQQYVSKNIYKICNKYGYSVPRIDLLNENCFHFMPSTHTNAIIV